MYSISKNEIQLSRSSSELYSWIIETFEKYDSEAGKKHFRLLEDNTKVLIEEGYPIAIFSKEYFSEFPNVQISLCIGSQNYDAIVKHDTHDSVIEYLEVTQAVNGKYEKIRMEELMDKGHVSAGKGFKDNRLPKGEQIYFSQIAESRSDRIMEIKQQIKDCVCNKNDKQYPPKTGLLVAFDDRLFTLDSNRELIALKDFINVEILPIIDNFSLFSLVGITDETVLSYPIKL